MRVNAVHSTSHQSLLIPGAAAATAAGGLIATLAVIEAGITLKGHVGVAACHHPHGLEAYYLNFRGQIHFLFHDYIFLFLFTL